ncbi:hypothetical protein BKA70DRAFT_1297254 [Coprinopsis sp. MPI-PUGE-AT-0042]|nr:hypothetical protein BKA70DRAFT_1297254 [Coprinopsis sp. MPI-PUGE-AT-0042]
MTSYMEDTVDATPTIALPTIDMFAEPLQVHVPHFVRPFLNDMIVTRYKHAREAVAASANHLSFREDRVNHAALERMAARVLDLYLANTVAVLCEVTIETPPYLGRLLLRLVEFLNTIDVDFAPRDIPFVQGLLMGLVPDSVIASSSTIQPFMTGDSEAHVVAAVDTVRSWYPLDDYDRKLYDRQTEPRDLGAPPELEDANRARRGIKKPRCRF